LQHFAKAVEKGVSYCQGGIFANKTTTTHTWGALSNMHAECPENPDDDKELKISASYKVSGPPDNSDQTIEQGWEAKVVGNLVLIFQALTGGTDRTADGLESSGSTTAEARSATYIHPGGAGTVTEVSATALMTVDLRIDGSGDGPCLWEPMDWRGDANVTVSGSVDITK
jgi:hypothetical protein